MAANNSTLFTTYRKHVLLDNMPKEIPLREADLTQDKTNFTNHENSVRLSPDGAQIASKDQLATLIARRLRPDVLTINSSPTEREIRDILGKYTSVRHGAVTKDMQERIEDQLRKFQE